MSLFFLHLALSAFMCGVIWVIQLVHYPSFLFVNEARFSSFENFHSKRISWVVIPAMTLELLTGALLFLTEDSSLFRLSILLLLFIWVYTFLVSARIHGQLMEGFSKSLVVKLIRTNWWRTAAWSVRLLVLLFLLQNQ